MMIKKINFKQFSSIKIGQELDVVMIEDFNYPQGHYLLGASNNVLIGTNPPPLMMLSKKYDYIKIENGSLVIGAATPSGKIVSFCKKHNIADFEFVSRLPGTLGGMLKMNAGLKEFEIFNNLDSIITKEGEIKKSEIDHGYRYTDIKDVVFEAKFQLNKGFDEEKIKLFTDMRSNQPKESSAGSCFKNPKGDYAGRLIEAVGLKGKRFGDMEFSSVHANFLVNHGEGRFEDAIELIRLVEEKVKDTFSIELQREIIIVDKNYL
ncbi:UDP-N-acetylmuramate dehydrogenase [Sulfurimonas sp. HSL-1716]|uniref:UDP-N-acetylmuramate dehydrogenase n=1 Tax=Hydrocurvibacter sulfurireducens TaxID=3131937 RepID=UPI0031F8ADE6